LISSLIGYLIEVRLFFWFAVAALPAAANDTLATLGAGGLIPVKSSQIAMEREDLQISIHQITVRYLFRNHSDRDVDATVAFPLPELEGPMVEHVPLALPSKTKPNFVDFEVQVAGKPVDTRMEVRAFSLDGREITDRLRAAGLPLSVNDEHFEDTVRKMPLQKRQPFEKEDLVLSDDGGKTWWCGWKTRVQFYWTQHFPAGSAVEVLHKYRPVVGGSFITATDTGASRIKPYCGGPDVVSQIQAVKRRHPIKSQDEPALVEKQIKYILTTANNWSGPIRDFHLTVITDLADDIVLTCMPELKRIAPTRYQLDRSAYRPDHDLDLLILHPSRP
jgi:hypothetical protein